MISDGTLEELSRIVGKEHIIHGEKSISEYASDGTRLIYPPDAVVIPANKEEISAILALATGRNFPVIPRGAGTGMTGGALPVKGGLVVAMNRFNRILEIDEDNMICRVEPGVITGHIQQTVDTLGLFYPPDPASSDTCTIGGNVAECAGGLRAVKYGVTRDYVLGLTAVLPNGDIITPGVYTMKGVAGYDLVRLITGSEGTLAIITEIILRLIPKPDAKRTMIAFFKDPPSAVTTVSDLIRNKTVPSILEFMDRWCIGCVRDELDIDIPHNANAMVLIEVDGDSSVMDKMVNRIKAICISRGSIRFDAAKGDRETERLWEVRKKVSPSLFKLRPHKISEDIVVPRSRMAELVAFLSRLGNTYGLPIPAFGHAGDGNIHVNIMFDRNNPEEEKRISYIVKELFKEVIRLKGTITGEHGIGITKAPYLSMEIQKPEMDLLYRIKKAFDPTGILNPGKIFTDA